MKMIKSAKGAVEKRELVDVKEVCTLAEPLRRIQGAGRILA